MTTHRTHRPGTPARPGPLPLPRTALVVGVLLCLALVGLVTLSPPGIVAAARGQLMDQLQVLAGPGAGIVHRAPVEAVANALLFLPVGGVLTLLLHRRSRAVPLLAGVVVSVAVELAQALLPGRVPDLGDVLANAAGNACGIALSSAVLVVRDARVRRRTGSGRPVGPQTGRAGLVAALCAVPVALAVLTACSSWLPGAAVSTVAGAGLTADDGYLPDGGYVSAFDDVPAVTNLDPALRAAVQQAQQEATADGIRFHVTSGWRSTAHQQRLLDDAVAHYGSAEEARRWVLPPDRSAHVGGQAVDIGPTDAMSWLSQHGAELGLCQVYANELWHHELTASPDGACPTQVPDAVG